MACEALSLTLRGRILDARSLGLCAVAVAVAATSGCGSGGPRREQPEKEQGGVVFRMGGDGASDASNTAIGFPTLDEGWRDAGYRLDWVGYPFVRNTTKNAVRLIAPIGDGVLAQDQRSVVSLLDVKTGQLKWSVNLDAPLTRFLSISPHPLDATRAIVSSESEAIIIALGSGNIVAREKFEKVVNTAPVSAGMTLVYGTAVGEVMGHKLGMGMKGWGFKGVGPIQANPVPVGETVATVSQGGDVTFINGQSGALVGRATIYGGLANNPVASGDSLIIAGTDQSVWSFGVTGQERWRVRTPHPLKAQPAAIGGVVYLDIPGQGMTALAADTGNQLWSNKDAHGRVVAEHAGHVLAFAGGTLYVLDKARGDLVRAVPTPGIARIDADKAEGGTLYAVSDRNVVAKLVPVQ